MDTNTLIALTVLIDYFRKEEALVNEALDTLERIPKILDTSEPTPEDIDPPCRMNSVPMRDYTYTEVRGIFTEKSSSGLKAEMKAILNAHGLQKLSDAKEDQQMLNRLATEAEAVGHA